MGILEAVQSVQDKEEEAPPIVEHPPEDVVEKAEEEGPSKAVIVSPEEEVAVATEVTDDAQVDSSEVEKVLNSCSQFLEEEESEVSSPRPTPFMDDEPSSPTSPSSTTESSTITAASTAITSGTVTSAPTSVKAVSACIEKAHSPSPGQEGAGSSSDVGTCGGNTSSSSNYGTLPKAMKKNISRSLVPQLRRMFERARSCEPEVLSPPSPTTAGPTPAVRHKRRAQPPSSLALRHRRPSLSRDPVCTSPSATSATEDTGGEDADESSAAAATTCDSSSALTSPKSDGTESVSSFVAVSHLGSDEDGDNSEAVGSREEGEEGEKSGSSGKRSDGVSSPSGFVNKCVSKVKNIMHSAKDADKK